MVLADWDIAPMPFQLTLGMTVALLQLTVEAVTFSFGEGTGLTFFPYVAEVLRRDAAVSPAAYFGGTFEGRECHRIGRKLMLVADLLDARAPGRGATARRRACSQWQVLLPTLNRADTNADDEITRFGATAASFVDGLKAAFAWFGVNHKMHALCCHATAFLWRFGSLGRYCKQGLEALRGRFNQDAARYTSATLLGSCEAFVKASAVGGPPGSAAHENLPKRSPAAPGARVAKRPGDKRTRAYKERAGLAPASAACRARAEADMTAWVEGVARAAATKISAHQARLENIQARAFTTGGRTAADLAAVSGWEDDGLQSDGEAAALMGLLGWSLETGECE